jgi:hypothetical protein
MVTPNTKLYTETEIIRLRDQMPVEELRKYTKLCREQFGYVSYSALFQVMGYVHAFNKKWYKPEN